VACQAIGEAGAFNAGLMAAQILATSDPALSQAIQDWRARQTNNVPHAVD
jgi:5-(carboxyamino)imidazole ribonucleotide mutase